MGVPLSLMAGSISIAVFPFMSSKATVDRQALAKETMRGLYASWLVALPIGVIFFVLSQPIIRIMFERGAFTPQATKITADMLAFFSLGIPAMTAWQIATRAFYALQDTITPLKVGFIQIGIDIALLLTLPKIMGYRGLPLATAISISIGFLILWLTLARKLPEIKEEKIGLIFYKTITMVIFQGAFLYFARITLWVRHKMTFLTELVFIAMIGGSSLLLYLLTGYLVRYPGIKPLISKLVKIIKKNKKIKK
jgi:putative peptidoglycan lipid II flippase